MEYEIPFNSTFLRLNKVKSANQARKEVSFMPKTTTVKVVVTITPYEADSKAYGPKCGGCTDKR